MFHIFAVNMFTEDMPGEKVCSARDDTDYCTFFFSFYNDKASENLVVEVQKYKGELFLTLKYSTGYLNSSVPHFSLPGSRASLAHNSWYYIDNFLDWSDVAINLENNQLFVLPSRIYGL